MAPSRAAKGKRRAVDALSDGDDSDALSDAHPVRIKKPRRAVTRKCPVCDEEIPVRLLDRHAQLEAERLNEIMGHIGSMEVLDSAEPDDGLTARTRKSAVKARQNMQPGSSKFPSGSATLELVDKSLRSIQRHRKQRHAKLRDMAREDKDAVGLAGFRGGRGRWAGGSEGTLCPVCMKMVPGDPDVVEAHVDACLAHEARLQEERERQGRERQREKEIDIGSEYHILATDGASLRGLGFAVRDDTHHDVDDEIDVDGEDEAVFGVAQFTEGDILGRASANEDEDVDVEDDGPEPTQSPGASGSNSESGDLRQSVVEGKVVKKAIASDGLGDVKETMDQIMGVGETEETNRAVDLARKSGNSAALVEALDSKIRLLESTRVSSSTSLLCRICIDPYTEPTVSTGCWHTCCRECWLRCLGSTRLCPICKRITAPTDLRRVYL